MTQPLAIVGLVELADILSQLNAELAAQNDYAGSFYCADLRRRIARTSERIAVLTP